MKRIPRLTVLLGIVAAIAAGSLSGASAAVTSPTGLHGFMLTADESASIFHQTPSFAWNPAPGAAHYQLQLATSSTFQDNGILFDSRAFLTPVAAPPLTLPWVTGNPHSLYARVRAIYADGGTSPWSTEYGFDVVPPAAPASLSSYDGLLRWSPVQGATGYEVWLLDARKIERVNTNVLDEREFYAFHKSQAWIGDMRWRVRAVRWNVLGRRNGMPVATHGAWSPIYHASSPTPGDAPIKLVGTISDTFSDGSSASSAHRLMPGFVWTGDQAFDGSPAQFFRVEVFTDSSCLNRVWVGATVASPAYAPRLFGTLAMPIDAAGETAASTGFLKDGTETTALTADGDVLTPNEQVANATPTTQADGSKDKLTIFNPQGLGAPVDLWDQQWPSSGYYWTVMPVVAFADPADSNIVKYYDMELPQDVCAAGRVQRFGVSSQPSLSNLKGHVFASGLSAQGRLVSAGRSAKFYGEPLVAWTPAVNATVYELQWSKKPYPFKAAGTHLTFATSFVLPLKPGTWYYRVRGFDYNLPTGAQEMAWTNPTKIVVASPSFRITK